MTMKDGFAAREDEHERIKCLVEQGFTPSLACNVIEARSQEYVPLTIWIVDNSGSMATPDGKRLLETSSQHDIRVVSCTRMEELKETVMYHAQLSALLEAPTKFVLLNKPNYPLIPQEFSIAERGSNFVQQDLQELMVHFPKIQPSGVTPLTQHLRRIYQSILHFDQKIVLVLATDGKPTDEYGYTSYDIDREFATALQQVQSKAWVVIRLCTNDESTIKYYQQFDDQLELSVDILDDYLDEAKEVHSHNPWLTYALCIHRCREMGMSCNPLHRWLDWLDERPLNQKEILDVLVVLGILSEEESKQQQASLLCLDASSHSKQKQDLDKLCKSVESSQQKLSRQYNELMGNSSLLAFQPWNPIKRNATTWIDCVALQGWKHNPWADLAFFTAVFVAILSVLIVLILKD